MTKEPFISVGENPKCFAYLAGFAGLASTKTVNQNLTRGDKAYHFTKPVQIVESTTPKIIGWCKQEIVFLNDGEVKEDGAVTKGSQAGQNELSIAVLFDELNAY